jgi:16S rRNA (uracil1498-N3)-methyltransferase
LTALFFDESLADDAAQIVLSGAEGRHAAVVRRMRPGERVDVTDGAGLLAECVVAALTPNGLELTVSTHRRVPKPDPAITVIQAIPKGDRGELAVEEMTEVGVDRIVPWQAERSVPIWPGKAKSLVRWRTTAREAAKQSLRAWIPEVTGVALAQEAVRIVNAATLAVVLDPAARVPLAGIEVPPSGDLVVVVGPEGGITDQERAAFLAAGATARRLGPTVLRTSTAGAVTAAILLSHTPRWS